MSSAKKAALYCSGSRIWIADRLNVWKCARLTADYKPGDAYLDYEIIADDVGQFADTSKRSRSNSCSSDSSSSSSRKRVAQKKVAAPAVRKRSKLSSEDEEEQLQVGDKGRLQLKEGELSLPPLRNPDILIGENDLTSMSYLHEPAVLYNLRKRFIDQREIYTYCGIVLVAINPYEQLNIYTEEYMHTYQGRTLGENDPHIFAIAEESFRQMKTLGNNQSIIVTGESGAGKTVSAKFAMRYFATIGGGSSDSQIEQKVLSSNPIMEAIGNAKTTRNDNSSRFGKYIEICFNKRYEIIGAAMRTYLLEKSRLIFQASNERNYHVFYQMCAARDRPVLSGLELSDPEDFPILYCGRCTEVDNVDDAKDFDEMMHSFSLLGIGNKFQSVFYRVLASILHMTSLVFENVGIEKSGISSSSQDTLNTTCSLLGIDAGQFQHWLCSRRIVTMAEVFIKPLTLDQAEASRDALAKCIYQLMFDKVVTKINKSLTPGKQKMLNFIGVLDIYGFEWFQTNSFEQFCINYANEKLQQQFCKHVFKLEQEEYLKEEIEWKMIDYEDNQECIAMIEAKLGILDLLDECCRMPKGDDAQWARMLYENHEKKSKHFVKPRMSRTAFQVVHFADTVEYQCDAFVEKNRDSVSEDLLEILRASDIDLICEIFKKPKEEADDKSQKAGGRSRGVGNRKKRLKTVGSSFRTSLQALMDTLESTTPHYVRCIKPNDTKSAFDIYPIRAVQQLRACGVLETIKISSAGYPSRWAYDEFFKRYRAMIKSDDIEWKRKPQPGKRGKVDLKGTSLNLLAIHIPDTNQYQMGKSKIFFRAGQVAYMEKVRSDMMYRCAVIIQKCVRCYQARKTFLTKRRAAVTIQRWIRGHAARQLVQSMRRENAAVKIQTCFRRHVAQKRYEKTRKAVLTIQSFTRGHFARKRVTDMRRQNAAVKLQSVARMFLAKRRYERTMHAIVYMQCCVRRKRARKEFRRLKMEAKSVDHIKKLNKGLENKIMQLQVKLNEERKAGKELDAVKAQKVALEEKLGESAMIGEQLQKQTQKVQVIEAAKQSLEKEITEKAETISTLQATAEAASKAKEAKDVEIAKLQEEGVQLKAEIDRERQAFELEKEELSRQVAIEQAEEIKKLRDDLEKLQQVHQKKSLDFDRLEQKYENLKQELNYTREEAERAIARSGDPSRDERGSDSDSEEDGVDMGGIGKLIAARAKASKAKADMDTIEPDFNNNTHSAATSTQSIAEVKDSGAVVKEANAAAAPAFDSEHFAIVPKSQLEAMRESKREAGDGASAIDTVATDPEMLQENAQLSEKLRQAVRIRGSKRAPRMNSGSRGVLLEGKSSSDSSDTLEPGSRRRVFSGKVIYLGVKDRLARLDVDMFTRIMLLLVPIFIACVEFTVTAA